MKCILIDRDGGKHPKKFIETWTKRAVQRLKARKIEVDSRELVLVFVKAEEIKRLNQQFRKKSYATDVLSFVGSEPHVLGELILCRQVLELQAKEHKMSYEHELGYMILHGILHLLGYDHEKSQRRAREMFQIQDDVFEELCQDQKHVSTSRIRRDQKKTRKLSRKVPRAEGVSLTSTKKKSVSKKST